MPGDSDTCALNTLLADVAADLAADDGAARARMLERLVRSGHDALPRPGSGRTLVRWQALADVARCDLPLAKLFEGHVDALAILAEAGEGNTMGGTWGMWAAESPGARVTFRETGDGHCTLHGTKAWCSGARHLDRALLTVWSIDGGGPVLAAVDLRQPGIAFDDRSWHAVGMAATDSHDVVFEAVGAHLVGPEGFYLTRPGFWQGGAGIAACWHGGACALADAMRAGTQEAPEAGWHRLLALGEIDHLLAANAALLREAAAWIDGHPDDEARQVALRTRAAAEAVAMRVLHLATRALGAVPLCRDAVFARFAADLPVFVRQSHGDRDLVSLGKAAMAGREPSWRL